MLYEFDRFLERPGVLVESLNIEPEPRTYPRRSIFLSPYLELFVESLGIAQTVSCRTEPFDGLPYVCEIGVPNLRTLASVYQTALHYSGPDPFTRQHMNWTVEVCKDLWHITLEDAVKRGGYSKQEWPWLKYGFALATWGPNKVPSIYKFDPQYVYGPELLQYLADNPGQIETKVLDFLVKSLTLTSASLPWLKSLYWKLYLGEAGEKYRYLQA